MMHYVSQAFALIKLKIKTGYNPSHTFFALIKVRLRRHSNLFLIELILRNLQVTICSLTRTKTEAFLPPVLHCKVSSQGGLVIGKNHIWEYPKHQQILLFVFKAGLILLWFIETFLGHEHGHMLSWNLGIENCILGCRKQFSERYFSHFQIDWMLLLSYCFVILHID